MRVVLKVTAAVHAEKDGLVHGMADHLFVAIRGVKVIDDYDEAQLQ